MNDTLDRRVADWLREGPEQGPPAALERTLAASRRTAQRPGWTFPERWLPMQLTAVRPFAPRLTLLFAIVALLLATVLAAAIYVGSRPRVPEPFGPAANGQIVAAVDGRLVLIEPDGSNVRPLGADIRGTTPTFSRDGTRIAYWSRTDASVSPRLVVAGADGTRIQELDADALPGAVPLVDALAFSPDGSRLLLTLAADGKARPFLFDVGDHAVTALGVAPGAITEAAWSPDGSLIAFRRADAGTVSLGVVTPDGSGERTLTTAPDDTSRNLQGFTWSPDGSLIAYQYLGPGGGEVATVDLDGAVHTIADTPVSEFNPAWSPSGDRIAFMAQDGEATDIAAADGSDRRTLVRGAFAGSGCRIFWSPDGEWILGSPSDSNCGPTDSGRLLAVNVADPGRRIEFDLPGAVNGLPSWQRVAD